MKVKSPLARAADLIATVPYATPGTVIALALIIAFSGKYGLNLYNTFSILIIAYIIKYLAFSVRTICASLEQIDLSLEEAAQISGASWIQSFKDIILPLVRPGLIAAWFLVFMTTFYELTMTILLYGPRTHNLGVSCSNADLLEPAGGIGAGGAYPGCRYRGKSAGGQDHKRKNRHLRCNIWQTLFLKMYRNTLAR